MRTGPSASRTKRGGAGWRARRCTPGARRPRCGSSSRRWARRSRPQGAGLLWAALLRPRRHAPEEIWLRFVDGRPVSAITTQFLAWAARDWRRRARRRWCWSGTTPRGMSAAWCALAARAQPARPSRRRGAPRALLPADQESVAQPHRAQVGPWQTAHRRARSPADRPRTGGTRLCRLRLSFRDHLAIPKRSLICTPPGPGLPRSDASDATREAVLVVFSAFHQYAGVAVGEHLGYLATGAWTLVIATSMLAGAPFRSWLGWVGIVSALGILAGHAGASRVRPCWNHQRLRLHPLVPLADCDRHRPAPCPGRPAAFRTLPEYTHHNRHSLPRDRQQ